MKNFPFKILFLCIFLPPILYILTLNGLEHYLQKRETAEIKQLLIQNLEALYEGRYTVKEEVNRNIGNYLRHDIKYRLGVRTSILVRTKDDRILFPSETAGQPQGEVDFSKSQTDSLRYFEVASENYKTLSEGLSISLAVQIQQNSWLANSILVFYVFLAVLVVQRFVRKGLKKSEREGEEQKRFIAELTVQVGEAESKLKDAEDKVAEYTDRINAFRKDKSDLARDVDGLLEEIEKQEAGLREQTRLKEEMANQVLHLREELDKVAMKAKKKRKTVDAAAKRFTVLYKNLAFTERAVEGFLDLTDEFQLKAEEVIHKLNEDESAVSVKRKVFGKGGKMNVLEVVFSYSGRIYYQKDSQPKKTIVAVGTKNTQEKDLAYLESIAS
jgi:hypothetical protein